MLRHWPVLLPLLLIACGLPRDPEKTSERIASAHVLRVGVTDNGAWVNAKHAEPSGIEADLVRQFARRIGARVLWSSGSETSLAQQLKQVQALQTARVRRFAELLWFELTRMRAEQAFLQVHLKDLAAVLGEGAQ